MDACLSKTSQNRPGITELLDRLTAPAEDATRWLPPEVTVMITKLEQDVRSAAPSPSDVEQPPARHGT
ncbi:hypothetical protein [Spirillospora sp. CA-128828]|uniref:hypothetical protein n=1 Tax=Spirillospora sp. CA-128828 TaxID=3240033 RepID=UPI003D8D3D30